MKIFHLEVSDTVEWVIVMVILVLQPFLINALFYYALMEWNGLHPFDSNLDMTVVALIV